MGAERDHQIVSSWAVILHPSKRLPEQTLHSIAADGIARPAGDGESQAMMVKAVGQAVDPDRASPHHASVGIHQVEFRAVAQSSGSVESEWHDHSSRSSAPWYWRMSWERVTIPAIR